MDKKVLDVGCGGGILSESMAQLGAKVTGLDQSDIAIKIAQLHSKENNLSMSSMKLVVNGRQKQHKGYKVFRLD